MFPRRLRREHQVQKAKRCSQGPGSATACRCGYPGLVPDLQTDLAPAISRLSKFCAVLRDGGGCSLASREHITIYDNLRVTHDVWPGSRIG
jgi:hypothetical protein